MILKVVKYKNYGFVFRADEKKDNWEHKFYWSFYQLNNGEIIGGAKAFIIIWSKIPKYKFLSKIFSIKPFFFVFHCLYEIAAYFLFLKNRKQLK